MLKVGELIRQKRRELGMTQAELAEKVGVTDGYIGKIEIGYQGAGLNTIIKIGEVLGISDDIFHAQIEPIAHAVGAKFANPGNDFKKLHPRVQALLLEIAPIIYKYL